MQASYASSLTLVQFSEASERCIVAGSPVEPTGCVLLHAPPPRRRSRRSAGRSGAGGRLVLERARPRSCSLPLPGSFPSRQRAAAQESRSPPFSAGLGSLPRLIRMMHTSSDSTIPHPRSLARRPERYERRPLGRDGAEANRRVDRQQLPDHVRRHGPDDARRDGRDAC